MPEETLKTKPSPKTYALLIGIMLAIFLGYVLISGFLRPSGCISGHFNGYTTEDYGEFCGQYPYTKISFLNWTKTGDAEVWECWENQFFFFGYHPELEKWENGENIRVCYHQESRGADSDASVIVHYYVIDRVEKIYKE